MDFQVSEAVELIKVLAETENLTLNDAFRTFVAEAGLDVEYASQLKGALFEKVTLEEMAQDSLSRALYNVFVTGVSAEESLAESDTKETQEGTKYKVRVKDRASGSSYIRYATREKIAELRANPNISSVEMTDHGTTGEDDRGERTAAAKTGRDFDGDGKRESSSKEHAGVVHNAIQRAKGGKPDGQDTRNEAFDPKGARRMDAAKGKKKETQDEIDKRLMLGKYAPGAKTRKEEVEVEEGIDFKGARREDDRRKKAQDEKDKKSPSSKDYRLAMGKFRPGASNKERAEGGRDVMREKGTSPTKKGKKMFEAYLEARAAIKEMKHRDAKTGEVTDKAEVGKTYYTDGPRQKSSVALRKEKEAAERAKKKVAEGLDMWKPDGDAGSDDKNAKMRGKEDAKKKKSSYLPNMETIKALKKRNMAERWVGKHGQFDTEYARSRSDAGKMISGDDKRSGAEYTHGRRVKAENPGMQPDVGGKTKPKSQGKMDKASRADLEYRKANLKKKESEKKTQKEEYFVEADLGDAGRENQSERETVKNGKKVDGKGVDNSTKVALMPYVREDAVVTGKETIAERRLTGNAVNEALRSKIQELGAGLQEECCDACGTPECTCEGKKEEKPKRKKKAKLDESGMPIFETKAESRNNARPGPSKDMIDPPADPQGPVGHMNPKGEPKRYKEAGEAPGDRRPNRKKDKSLPNEDGTVPNGAGV